MVALNRRARQRRLASAAARVTLDGHGPAAGRSFYLAIGFVVGAIVATAATVALWPSAQTSRDDAVAVARPAPTRPMPEISSVLDIDGLWARVDALESEAAAARDDAARLQAVVDAAESRIQIEKSTASQLAAQIRGVEAENARLKSDLVYLESLLPASGGSGPIQIRGLQVQAEPLPNQMRWRAMLVSGGRKSRAFSGHLQLLVRYELDGRAGSLVVPKQGRDPAEAGMAVSFERFRRVEGQFTLPAGATLKGIELRVMKGSGVQAKQSLSL
jgi:hypothetical protein